MSKQWPIWEVFIRSKNGLEHTATSAACTPPMAKWHLKMPVMFIPVGKKVGIWASSKEIIASNPKDSGELFEPAADKPYRHPTFYDMPNEVKHI
ncbi:MAG: 1,2-phenylacetyl-CoA epoxidase subunit B [Saprospiraceae bacterium]